MEKRATIHAERSANEVDLFGEAFILSPFDILNVFRNHLKDIFDFDYQIECLYRLQSVKYGYFSLPVLVGHFRRTNGCQGRQEE